MSPHSYPDSPIVLVRPVSPQLQACELTHLPRAPIDAALAGRQHAAYVQALATLGANVVALPPLPDHPDSVFVEDTAVVLPEVAVIARPGVASRRPETESVAAMLTGARVLRHIPAPACLEGGDVLRIGRVLYAGLSDRTNAEGIRALREAVASFGYEVRPLPVQGCLHLKTGATFIPPGIVLLNPAWVDTAAFGDYDCVEVDPAESFAANTLTLGGTTLVSAAQPRTRARLEARGVATQAVDISELEKAEAGLTCMSLVLSAG